MFANIHPDQPDIFYSPNGYFVKRFEYKRKENVTASGIALGAVGTEGHFRRWTFFTLISMPRCQYGVHISSLHLEPNVTENIRIELACSTTVEYLSTPEGERCIVKPEDVDILVHRLRGTKPVWDEWAILNLTRDNLQLGNRLKRRGAFGTWADEALTEIMVCARCRLEWMPQAEMEKKPRDRAIDLYNATIPPVARREADEIWTDKRR